MKKIIYIIVFLLINLFVKAQTDSIKGNISILKGKLISTISFPPDCGTLSFGTVVEFEIFEFSDSTYLDKDIGVIFTCPELYKDNFFEVGKTYEVKVTDENQAGFSWIIPNEKILDKYKLKSKLWVIKAKKIIDSGEKENALTPIETDSSKKEYLTRIKLEDSIQTERNIILRQDFYSKPPFLTLNFEKNKERIQLSDNFKFWFEVQDKRYEPTRINDNQFLIDSISDSITVVFVYEKDSLRFKNIKYNWIKYGASLRFGIVENIEQIRSLYKKQKRIEDFDERTEIGQPYLRLLQDKNIKKNRRKIESIDFLALIPRTYGDGCNFDMVTIKAKKTPSP